VSQIWYDITSCDLPNPKRGDTMQSNIGDKRERTWLILRARRMRTTRRRFKIWLERWWEIEPELRQRLAASAERNGGQHHFPLHRWPAKKKRSFEQLMTEGIKRASSRRPTLLA